jgi:hypothetical protein
LEVLPEDTDSFNLYAITESDMLIKLVSSIRITKVISQETGSV